MDGAVKFNVSANTAQFDAAMRRVGSVAQTTGDRVRSAFSGLGGLLAGGAIVAGLQNILSKMDDISDRAKRFRVSAEEIQRVGNAADIVGTNFDSVARAINRTGVAANKAAREGGSVAEAFSRVNLDPAAFAAASLEERIQMIGKAQQAANGDAQKMSDLFEVIGVKASNINFTELLAEMKQVNAASNQTVETLAEANDRLERAGQAATVFGANLINGISKAAERFGSLLAGAGFKTIEELDQQIARDNASARLQQQGRLLLGADGRPITDPGAMAPNTRATQDLRSKAAENARRIDAEVARAEAERKAAENANRKIRTEGEEGPSDAVGKASIASGAGAPPLSAADAERRFREIQTIYNEQLEIIRNSSTSSKEFGNRLRALNQHMDDALRDLGARSPSNQAGNRQAFGQMTNEAALPEAARQRAAEESRAASGTDSAQADRASETTLQKVAALLDSLNTKLPQPVLV